MPHPTVPAGWTLGESDQGLTKTLTFKNFVQALAFVVEVGRAAEEANHHPDVSISWSKVDLKLITHSQGKVTENDYAMAERLNAISAHQVLARVDKLFVPIE